jgi:hypothetical protein
VTGFSLRPSGAFSLRAASEYFGGWGDSTNGSRGPIPIAFPVEGWEASAAVVLTQAEDGSVHGDVSTSEELAGPGRRDRR